jgi:hypothetical protein
MERSEMIDLGERQLYPEFLNFNVEVSKFTTYLSNVSKVFNLNNLNIMLLIYVKLDKNL